MNQLIDQRIIYSQMSKNDDFQSIRTKGARQSFDVMTGFLNDLGIYVNVRAATLHASVFEQNDRHKVKIAKEFLKELSSDLGKPSDKGAFVVSGSFNDWFPRTFIERYPSWKINLQDIVKSLEYIDNSKFPPELSSRPPLALMVDVDFQLKHKHRSATGRLGESSAILFLSQKSNSIGLTMTTPYTEYGKEFEEYRASVQSFSPIELKDKYFYLEKTYDNNKVTYRKLYSSK
jgi:hypothetical protein